MLFAFDVSGMPFTDTIISCVCFNINTSPQVISNFKKRFKKYINKKGKQLNHKILADIMQFLDENKIRSCCMRLSTNDWDYALKKVPIGKGYRKEKILGIYYYILLEPNSKYKFPYSVNVCEESFMKIDKVISSCRIIAKMRGKDFSFSKGRDKTNDYIKIADYVASATRNMNLNKLISNYKYYRFYKPRLPAEYIQKVFK